MVHVNDAERAELFDVLLVLKLVLVAHLVFRCELLGWLCLFGTAARTDYANDDPVIVYWHVVACTVCADLGYRVEC